MLYIHVQDIHPSERHLVPFDLPRIERLRRLRIAKRKAKREEKRASQAARARHSTIGAAA